jgi:uncharacterized SAM-binding protein YcdF (DUF218 family)
VFLALSKTLDLAVAPLTWALALLVAAALLRRRGRTPWTLAGIAVAVLVAFSISPVDNALERAVEAGARSTFRPAVVYDAAIVLSGMVDDAASRRSGELELTQEADRVVRAFELWRTGHVRMIVLSGGSSQPFPGDVPEPDRLRDALVRWGVPPDAILVEDRSRNTRENAIEAARVAAARNLRSLLLVTSAAHVPRALGCFRAVGLAPDVLPVDRRAGGGASWLPRAKFLAQSTAALHELAGRVVYWIVGYTR